MGPGRGAMGAGRGTGVRGGDAGGERGGPGGARPGGEAVPQPSLLSLISGAGQPGAAPSL